MTNFEIHITVDCPNQEELIRFQAVCEEIGAKCIVINFDTTKQIMTSKTFYGTYLEALNTCIDDKYTIVLNHGFKVDRIKIEAELEFIKKTNTSYDYYEIHVPCRLEIDQLDLNSMECSWYRSRNLFKPDVRIITCREHDQALIPIIDRDIEKLKSANLVHDEFKHHYEFVVLDINKGLDIDWIT